MRRSTFDWRLFIAITSLIVTIIGGFPDIYNFVEAKITASNTVQEGW